MLPFPPPLPHISCPLAIMPLRPPPVPLVFPRRCRTTISTPTPTPTSAPALARAVSTSFSSSSSSSSENATTTPKPSPAPHWLSDLRARIGKCLIFGCTPQQIAEAGAVLRALATEWRGLVAGSEGFLTGGRRGLEGQQVVWGEMDSFVRPRSLTGGG